MVLNFVRINIRPPEGGGGDEKGRILIRLQYGLKTTSPSRVYLGEGESVFTHACVVALDEGGRAELVALLLIN